MKSILLVILLGIAAFCAFGFAATFEPLERSQRLMWRTAYGIIGVAATGGVVWALVKRRRTRGLKGSDE
jgi:hypothetical protein